MSNNDDTDYERGKQDAIRDNFFEGVADAARDIINFFPHLFGFKGITSSKSLEQIGEE